MEGDLDMDELFGDGANLDPPLVPIPKGLHQRIEEVRSSGCSQKLSWSNLGCVAYISDEDLGVCVRNLFCQPESGCWTLSKGFPIPQVQAIHDGQSLAHISWNHTGSELAVVDVLGRLSIFSIVIAMNRLTSSRSGLLDQPDDLGALVGLSWLNHDRAYPIYRPAVKIDGRFEYNMVHHKPMGPFHPHHSKSALLCVTRAGIIRLIFQTPEAGWLEVRAELGNPNASDDVLSHASLCSDQDNKILLLIRTIAYDFRLYRLEIKWNMPPNQRAPVAPIISIQPLKTSFPSMRYFYSASPGMSHTNLAASQLSHLEIVSFTPNLEAQEPSFPTLLAVYSNLPSPDDPGAEPASSSILMWELTSVPQKLHSSFDQLASRNNGTSSADQQTHYLKQREGITVSKTVLSIHPIHTNTVFIITYSDGSVEFRDRASLDIIFANDDFGTVSSMPQIGFAIPSDDHCLHLAVSPNFCLAVAMDSDGTPRLKTMQYTLGDPGDSNDDPKFAAVVTALTLQFVYSCAHHNNNDDLCATIRQFTNPNLEHEFLSEIYRAMTMSVDYSTETQHEKLFRNPMIQRCLSMQNALNYRGEDTHRTLNAKVAWLTLHLRLVALTFAFSFNTGPKANGDRGGSESEFTKPDVLHSILGIVRYYIDFTNFLMDELFELANLLKDQQLTIPLLQEHIRDTNSPALLILLSSIPRTLIRYNSRGIRVLRSALAKMFDPANPARMSANDPSLRPSLTTLITLVDRSPVRITDYERFISELDTQIKDAYNSSACAEPERRQAEKLLLISGTIPPPLLPAIKNILGPTLNAMRTGIDPAALYFADYSWLGVSDDKRTHDWARTHILDAIRKIELSEATQLRICTRCCATMEDVRPQKGSSVWMTSIQKMCLCGSLWMLFDASEKGRDDGLQRLNG